ncbi:MAG: cephalosporin hydroxylase family protein [Acidimicrobiales bacterium]
MAPRRDVDTIRAERKPGDPRAIAELAADAVAKSVNREWIRVAARLGYSYNFTWLGVPIIQHPEDIVVVQELIWRARPDLVIETGIAHGGSLLLSASILRLLGGERQVLGVDVDIRAHARETLVTHPLAGSISTIEGDSVSPEVFDQVVAVAHRHAARLAILDSNHTASHVAEEIRLYSDLVTVGSYLVVMDTLIKDLPPESSANRPCGPDDNPWVAVEAFLETDRRFVRPPEVNDKLFASVAPGGYLLRVA